VQLHHCDVRHDRRNRPLLFVIHGDDDALSDLCRAFDIEITQSFSCELTFTRIDVVGELAVTAQDGDVGPISDPRSELRILDFIPRMRLVEAIPRLSALSVSSTTSSSFSSAASNSGSGLRQLFTGIGSLRFSMATSAARAAVPKLMADEGDSAAQFAYGECLQRGIGIVIDEIQASKPANTSNSQRTETIQTASEFGTLP
jgi:hypothetical protein